MGGRGTGSAGGQDDGVSRVIPRQGLHRQLVGKGQAHGLRLHELHPHGFGALDAPALQLGPRDGAGHAVVVLDALGPGPVRRATGQDGGVDAGPRRIQAADTPPARTNDYNLCHSAFLRVVPFCLSYSISHFGAGFRDRLTKLRLGPGQQLPDRRGVAGVGPGRQHFVQGSAPPGGFLRFAGGQRLPIEDQRHARMRLHLLEEGPQLFFLQGGQAGLGLALRQLEKTPDPPRGNTGGPPPAGPRSPAAWPGGRRRPHTALRPTGGCSGRPHTRPFQGVVGAGAARQLEPFGGQVLQTPALDLGRVDGQLGPDGPLGGFVPPQAEGVVAVVGHP